MKQLRNLGYAAVLGAAAATVPGCKALYAKTEDKPAPVVRSVGEELARYQTALNTIIADGYVSAPGKDSDVNEMTTLFSIQEGLADLEGRVKTEGDKDNVAAHAGLTARANDIVNALYGSNVLDNREFAIATVRNKPVGNTVSYLGVEKNKPAMLKGTASDIEEKLGVSKKEQWEKALYNTDAKDIGYTKESWAAAKNTRKNDILGSTSPVAQENFGNLKDFVPQSGWVWKLERVTANTIALLNDNKLENYEFVRVRVGATVAPDAKVQLSDEAKQALGYTINTPQPVVEKPADKPADKPTGKPADKPADKPDENPLKRESDKPEGKDAEGEKNFGLPDVPKPAADR